MVNMSSKKRKTSESDSAGEGVSANVVSAGKRGAGPAAPEGPSSAAQPTVDAFNNPRTVYIEGLPFDASEEDVRAFFRDAGPVRSLRLPRWHDSGRLRGYGHVEFGDVEAAARALELNGI
jgi:nucleolin